MPDFPFEIRSTPHKGRGLFTRGRIARGEVVLALQGRVLSTEELTDEMFVMQLGPDRWLCSEGDLLDDCMNHSCEPNTGFVTGEPILFALRDIDADEELTWDYSTSIAEPEWSLECRCESVRCRGTIRPWGELTAGERDRLRGQAMQFLRER